MVSYFPIVTGSLTVTGSINVSGGITASGGISISGSIASASYAASASNALSASNASAAATASYVLNAVSASYSNNTTLAANSTLLNSTASAVFATTGSNTFIGTEIISGSLTVSGSQTFIGTKTITGSVFISGSKTVIGTNTITGSMLISGSLTATGTITAQTLLVSTINVTQSYSSGSNIFGNALNNTQTFTGSVLITGSVGIGTSVNASRTAQILQYSGSSSALRLIASTGGNSLLEFLGDGALSQPTIGVTSTFPNDLSISAGGSIKMFISASGKVGIGTTSPNEVLQVVGAISSNGVATTAFGSSATMDWNNGNYRLISRGANTTTAGGFEFRGQSSNASVDSNPMTITSTGIVNINGLVTSANYKLGVSGSAYINGSNGKGIFVTDNATYASVVGLNSAISAYNALEIRGSGTDYQLYLSTNGNIGIGTNSPGYKLEVGGNGSIKASSWFGNKNFGVSVPNNTWTNLYDLQNCLGNGDSAFISVYGFTTGYGKCLLLVQRDGAWGFSVDIIGSQVTANYLGFRMSSTTLQCLHTLGTTSAIYGTCLTINSY
jgi:hypothetical protein